ncbi:MAG: ChbG/HpnK family deacetylase [Candidatus Marinimicrobia bacterium]|nr:ChbG/HpnK family deacetylase [FCB group bacterium]MBL7023970.1 ChbG/HpnK family deacetylase [Candidatus Neomarinimicrobiota bacterium]
MLKKIVLQIAIFSLMTCSVQQENIRYLIRLDDMGMCHSVNMAIEQVAETGMPFSTSVMFACPWYEEAVEILKQHPQVSVGIHLTLNAEWAGYRWGPILGPEVVPSLVDSVGTFFPSRTKLFENNPDVGEITRELRAQIDRAMDTGLNIDYVDYHMGAAVQTLELREIVEGLAAEYGLAMSGYFGEIYSNITYATEIGSKSDSLLAHVSELGEGLHMQVVHVGLDAPEMQAMQDLNEFGLKEMSRHRQDELKAVLNPELRLLVKDRGIELVTYGSLVRDGGLENMQRPEIEEYK